MDWILISDGLTLSVVGMLTTFLALGLFILSMMLLRWIFPTEKRRRPSLQVSVSVPVETAESDQGDTEEEELAAAMAAAMMLRKALPSQANEAASEAAAAAAAAWWLKQNRSAGQTVYNIHQAPAPRKGLGARLESSRGRWWKPLGGED